MLHYVFTFLPPPQWFPEWCLWLHWCPRVKDGTRTLLDRVDWLSRSSADRLDQLGDPPVAHVGRSDRLHGLPRLVRPLVVPGDGPQQFPGSRGLHILVLLQRLGPPGKPGPGDPALVERVLGEEQGGVGGGGKGLTGTPAKGRTYVLYLRIILKRPVACT